MIISFDDKFKCRMCLVKIDHLVAQDSNGTSGNPGLEVTIYLCPNCDTILGLKGKEQPNA